MEYVNCNNCGQDTTNLLFTKRGFNIVRCSSCGLVYTNPRVPFQNTKDIYNQSYFKSGDSLSAGYDNYIAERPTIEVTFKKRLDFIMRNAPSLGVTGGRRVLDIGCAAGFLLDILRKNGWECEGVELSEYAVDYANKELKIDVRQGVLGDFEYPENHFDLVVCWDVIEHCYDPKRDLKIMYNIVKSGGYLSLITPDMGSLHAKIARHRWVEFEKPEEHLYFFSKEILKRILREIGFELVASTTAGKYVTVNFALNRLKSYSGIFGLIQRAVNERSGNRYIFVNPFDKMFILARKV